MEILVDMYKLFTNLGKEEFIKLNNKVKFIPEDDVEEIIMQEAEFIKGHIFNINMSNVSYGDIILSFDLDDINNLCIYKNGTKIPIIKLIKETKSDILKVLLIDIKHILETFVYKRNKFGVDVGNLNVFIMFIYGVIKNI